MNTKTEKPKSFGPKTEKPIEKIAKTAKSKILMPPPDAIGFNYSQINKYIYNAAASHLPCRNV